MKITIRKYDPDKDYEAVLEVIRAEGEEWKEYLDPKYKMALERSITYVACADERVCGYSRSHNDSDLYIWILDLLVNEQYRGHGVGKRLMDCVLVEFPNFDAYVMSDADGYYEKLGYKKEGTIFKVESTRTA